MGVIGDHEEGQFLLLSFYSPYVENEIRDFVINEIYQTLTNLGQQLPQFLIIGGDTNTVFAPIDKKGGVPHYKYNAINAYNTLANKFSLIDTYRY